VRVLRQPAHTVRRVELLDDRRVGRHHHHITAADGDLVIAAACIHFGASGGGTATSPSWTNSFANQLTATSGGTASVDTTTFYAELTVGAAGSYSSSASWTGSAGDRQQLMIAFKAGAAATATYPPQRPSPRRAVPARIARERITSVVPRQLNPPYPFQEVAQERRIRGLLLRRTKLSQTVPPQFNPPYPFAEVVQKRRLRGMPTRRGHRFDPAWPALTAPGNPAFVSATRRLPRLIGFVRRERVAQVLPPDGPVVSGKRDRPIVIPARRGRLAQPVLTQQAAPTNPLWIPDRIRERVRLAFIRRGRMAPPPPAVDAGPIAGLRRRLAAANPARRFRGAGTPGPATVAPTITIQNAASSATVTANQTSTSMVTATDNSTSGVTARSTSSPNVSDG
jgi:hypothetical protein